MLRWRLAFYGNGYRIPTKADWLARWEQRPELYEDLHAVVFGGATLRAVAAQRRSDLRKVVEYRERHNGA